MAVFEAFQKPEFLIHSGNHYKREDLTTTFQRREGWLRLTGLIYPGAGGWIILPTYSRKYPQYNRGEL